MLFKKLFSEEKAVSPVIAVMLMVVVTVILAAAVSSYAGSMSIQETSPQATLKASASFSDFSHSVDDGTGNITNYGYIKLEHLGGDILTKSNIEIEIASGTPLVSGYVEMTNVTFSPQKSYLRPGDIAKIPFKKGTGMEYDSSWNPILGSEFEKADFTDGTISQSVPVGTPFKVTVIDKESGQTIYSSSVVMNP